MAEVNVSTNVVTAFKKETVLEQIKKDFERNKVVIFMTIPVVLWYIIFHYIPMYGVIIGFKDFNLTLGILGSKWIGFRNFYDFFSTYYATRVIRNTLLLNMYQLIFSFPLPIIVAALLNEVKNVTFKRTVQTVTYLPHFISTVIICGMIIEFVSVNGLINDIVAFFGGERVSYLQKEEYYRLIYIGSGIWQGLGWSTIIYLAALTGVDMQLYEAATIDGANRFKQFIHVTLPGMAPTIVILLILNTGKIMSEGAEKTILIYNPGIYETADIISSFVYRRGLQEQAFGFSTAVGLFNSVVNLALLAATNWVSRRVSETSLW